MTSTVDHLAEEFDFKKDFEEHMRHSISEQMIRSIQEDPFHTNEQKRQEMLNYIEEEKKKRISLDDVFNSDNKIMDVDKGNRMFQSTVNRVGLLV